MHNNTKFLDGLRGLAAVYVLIHHARWLLTESYSLRSNTFLTTTDKIIAFSLSFFRFGHEMVIFFFILSGFVIHLSTLKNKNSSTFLDIKGYIIKRINRIYPPFIFALIITFSIDYIGKNYLGFQAYKSGSKYYALSLNTENFSYQTFLGNLANLQGLIPEVPIFGTNAALWSLSFEWWFYLLYPFFYYIHKRNILLTLCIHIGLFMIAAFYQSNIPIFTMIFQKMAIWWFGVLLAELYVSNTRFPIKYLSLLILAIPLSIIFFYNNRLYGDIFWGFGFTGILSLLLCVSEKNIVIRILVSIKNLGKSSYTIYLIHVPIIFLAYAYLIDKNNGNLPLTYFWMVFVSIIVVAFSIPLAKWIEKVKLINQKK